MSIKNQQQETEAAEIILERIMTIADLLIRRSDEDQVEPPDDSSESSEKTQESKPDVD
ncbi:MAG: hypothetical protein ABI690_34375 [Chloroflexota bacterium]